jgi:alpha-galactosidase
MTETIEREKWKFSAASAGAEWSHPATGALSTETSRLQFNHTERLPLSSGFQDGQYDLQFESGIGLKVRVECEPNRITFFPRLSNDGQNPIAVGDVEIVNAQTSFQPGFSNVLVNGRDMVENSGLIAVEQDALSNTVLGLTDASGTQAFAVGAIRPDDAWYDVSISVDEKTIRNLKVICRLENTLLAPHTSRTLSPIRFYNGHSLARLMECYAEDVAEQMVPAGGFKNAPAGWCSWYHYYGTDNADDIRQNMQAIKTSPLNDRLKFIQIDAEWNRLERDSQGWEDWWNLPGKEAARWWGDWVSGGKYPQGMKALVEEIHSNGFQAGLWLAPFSVDKASQLYKKHPDWVVQVTGQNSKLNPLAGSGGAYGLDLTNPGAQEFIRTTFRRVFKEWGFDYIKIDFLVGGAMEGHRADQTKTGVEAFRIGMQIIREEAGQDKFILNCGSPIAAAIGLCDGMRVGMDTGGRWFAPMNLKEWRFGNCCIKAAANSTIWRQWMHRIWWHNDPDCALVRNQPIEIEMETFRSNPLEEAPVCAEDFVLSEEETLGWLRLIWMSGGAFVVSEEMASLSTEQWDILAAMWPLNTRPVRWIDDYNYPDVGLLRTSADPPIIGIFNLSDESKNIYLASEKVDLFGNWSFVEKLTGETFDGTGTIVFPEIPAHAGRIWELKK